MDKIIDIGDGRSLIFPRIIEGRVAPSSNANQISITPKRKKYPQYAFFDYVLGEGFSFRSLEGRKVRITVEILDDKRGDA